MVVHAVGIVSKIQLPQAGSAEVIGVIHSQTGHIPKTNKIGGACNETDWSKGGSRKVIFQRNEDSLTKQCVPPVDGASSYS